MVNNLTLSDELVLEQLGIDPNNLLADFPTREYRLQYRAVIQWLIDYNPRLNATNLEKVKRYLEAFQHLSEVEDWDMASKILIFRFKTPLEEELELHTLLQSWGYFQEHSQICRQLFRKSSTQVSIICSRGIGNSYYYLGKYQKAIEYYKWSLVDSIQIGDRKGERMALGNIGNCYHSLGNYHQAIDFHQKNFNISVEINDLRGQGTALGNLGFANHYLGKYDEAIQYYKKSLEIADHTMDSHGKKRAIANLGFTYHYLGDYKQALIYHNQYLNIVKELGDRFGISNALCNLGRTLIKINRYSDAQNSLEVALKIAEEIKANSLEAEICRYLAELLYEVQKTEVVMNSNVQARSKAL